MAKAKTTSKTTRKATKTENAKKTATKTTAKKAAKPTAAKVKTTVAKSKTSKPAAAKQRKPATETDKVTMNRRAEAGDRRKSPDRRKNSEPVAVERRAIERRVKVNRRRQIDPTTCERDYSDEELEFMNAMDEYKRSSGRMFPTCSEVLEVIKGLGYEKRSEEEPKEGNPSEETGVLGNQVGNFDADSDSGQTAEHHAGTPKDLTAGWSEKRNETEKVAIGSIGRNAHTMIDMADIEHSDGSMYSPTAVDLEETDYAERVVF